MSGYGWNSSGFGNPNGLNRAPPTYRSTPGREYCIFCHQVFSSIEALINHYSLHVTDGNSFLASNNPLMQQPFYTLSATGPAATFASQGLVQNNYVRVRNQAAAAPRSLSFGPGQNQPLLPPFVPAHPPQAPPPISSSTRTFVQQRRIQQPAVRQVGRRQNLAPPNGNMTRATTASRASAHAQPSQSAVVPDEIELEFGDIQENGSSTDGAINLDLTLGL